MADIVDQQKLFVSNEAKLREQAERIARFDENIKKNSALHKEGEAALLVLNQSKIAITKEIAVLKEQLANVQVLIDEKLSVEKQKLSAMTIELEKKQMAAQELFDKAEAKSIKTDEMKQKLNDQSRDMATQQRALDVKLDQLKGMDEKLATLTALETKLALQSNKLEERASRIEASERAYEKKANDLDKNIALLASKEAVIASKQSAASTMLEKYKVATSDINHKENELKRYKGEVVILEEKARKLMLEAETLMKSVESRENEVKAQWARVRKLSQDQKIQDIITAA